MARRARSDTSGASLGQRHRHESAFSQAGPLYDLYEVSTEHGLDQKFNSLDAQYEAASAYIKSQAHAGWTLIRSRYNDGGYSGGSTDRSRPTTIASLCGHNSGRGLSQKPIGTGVILRSTPRRKCSGIILTAHCMSFRASQDGQITVSILLFFAEWPLLAGDS